MLTTDDLADVLRERSEHDRRPPGPVLSQRIERSRRRRLTGTAVAAALLAVAVAVPITVLRAAPDAAPPDGESPPVAAPPPDAARTPLQYTRGYKLADSREAVLPKDETFTYTFTPSSYDFQFMLWCDSTAENRLNVYIADKQVLTDYCEPGGRRQEILPHVHSQPMASKQATWQPLGVELNRPLTVRVVAQGGLDDMLRPVVRPGTVRLLLYLPVAFKDFPFPEPPANVQGFAPRPQRPDAIEASHMESEVSYGGRKPSGERHVSFTVVKPVGRDIEVVFETLTPGIIWLSVDGGPEVAMMEFWDWKPTSRSFILNPRFIPGLAALPVGQPVAVNLRTDFQVPMWRITSYEIPPA